MDSGYELWEGSSTSLRLPVKRAVISLRLRPHTWFPAQPKEEEEEEEEQWLCVRVLFPSLTNPSSSDYLLRSPV